jgi:hypothetical protein
MISINTVRGGHLGALACWIPVGLQGGSPKESKMLVVMESIIRIQHMQSEGTEELNWLVETQGQSGQLVTW